MRLLYVPDKCSNKIPAGRDSNVASFANEFHTIRYITSSDALLIPEFNSQSGERRGM